jgi:hypothetical protein
MPQQSADVRIHYAGDVFVVDPLSPAGEAWLARTVRRSFSAVEIRMPIRRGDSACCARAVSGHVAAAPPEILLRIDAAGLEQARHDRIEHDAGRQIRGGGQAPPELRLPGVARPESFLDVAVAHEHGHGAVGWLQAFLHMERLPRAALLVLGKAQAVGERVVDEMCSL